MATKQKDEEGKTVREKNTGMIDRRLQKFKPWQFCLKREQVDMRQQLKHSRRKVSRQLTDRATQYEINNRIQ